MGRRNKVVNIDVNTYGNYLTMQKGCLVINNKKDKNGKKYPLTNDELGEVAVSSGNMVSVGALNSLARWGIDVVLTTSVGRPVALVKSLDDDSHVKTRTAQYEALENGKGINVAKAIVKAKAGSQNEVLKKYGLRQHDLLRIYEDVDKAKAKSLNLLRHTLNSIEGRYSRNCFEQVFDLFPYGLKPDKRIGFGAYDGVNNLFNLSYDILYWKTYRALSRAHLEPHLGFQHAVLFGRPSLVSDFEELYRYFVDDCLLTLAKTLRPRDFQAIKVDKEARRMFLTQDAMKRITGRLSYYFKTTVEVPRVKRGKKQEIESLINEEALLLARYLRSESDSWVPRCPRIV